MKDTASTMLLFLSFYILLLPAVGYSQNQKKKIDLPVTFTESFANGDKYQWSCDDGLGFQPISGATKKTFTTTATADHNGYRYKCDVTIVNSSKHGIIIPNTAIDTLTVITSITLKIATSGNRIDTLIMEGDQVSFTSDAIAKARRTYQWFEDNTPVAGATNSTYSMIASCDKHKKVYTCQVADIGHSPINSNIDTLLITGCISPTTVFTPIRVPAIVTVSNNTKGLTYEWWQKKYDRTYPIPITIIDSSEYTGYDKDTLKIINVNSSMQLAQYFCRIKNKLNSNLFQSDISELQIYGNRANYPDNNRLQFMAAYYSGIQGLQDDNSANFTQIYLRTNYMFKPQGVDVNADRGKDRCIWFRNLFFQCTYSTNANNINYFNTQADSFTGQDTVKYRGVNRLDLLKNANLNFTFTLPMLTYIFPEYRPHTGDFLHLYIEPFAGLLLTTVSSKNLRDTTNPIHVTSIQYGIAVGTRTETLAPFYIEFTGKAFYIDVLSTSINPSLNYMENKVLNDYNGVNSKPILTLSNPLYWNLDWLVMYNTSNTGTSNVFLHFSWYTNIVNPSVSGTQNTFWQLQGGYALDINTFWAKLKKS